MRLVAEGRAIGAAAVPVAAVAFFDAWQCVDFFPARPGAMAAQGDAAAGINLGGSCHGPAQLGSGDLAAADVYKRQVYRLRWLAAV